MVAKDTRARTRAPRRRELEFARTREDILLAAARALGRRGFGSVSMQEIAAEVGFTAPALYAYFSSKEDIFSELKAMLQREIAETFQPPPPAGQPFRRQLSILLRRQLEWADRRRDVLLAFTAMRARGESMPFRAQSEEEQGPWTHLRAMARWIRQAAGKSEDLGGSDPDEAATYLFGVSHGFLLRWLSAGTRYRLADDTERILDLFFHGVLGARAIGGPPPRTRVRRSTGRRPHRVS